MTPPFKTAQTLFDTKLAGISDLPTIITANDEGFLTRDNDTSPLTSKYLRTSIVPRETIDSSIGIGGCDNFGGVFLIEIFTPTYNGIAETNYWVDEIISYFPKTTQLTDGTTIINIEQYTPLPGQPSTNYHRGGLMLKWSSYVQR